MIPNRFNFFIPWVAAFLATVSLSGCAGRAPVQKQEYAELPSDRFYEYEFPVVWKAVEKAFQNYKVVDRDPSEVNEVELRKLSERSLETDWLYSESRDKYVEYRVNDVPKRKALEVRIRYKLEAKKVLGGVRVSIKTEEELESLGADGSSHGYSKVDHPDSSRPNELLEKINLAILAANP